MEGGAVGHNFERDPPRELILAYTKAAMDN
jgi:hypothetical protein